MHVPVMLAESIAALAVRPDGIYVDATCGLAGHTIAIARLLTTGRVIANDRDAESLEIARRNAAEYAGRITFVHGRFSELPASLGRLGIAKVDGILADLGASRYQLTSPERGFSFLAEGLLDCRMDRSQGPTAAELVNTMTESKLAELFYLGEERKARRAARAILRARPVRTTRELTRALESALPRTGRLHPATRVFLALRLAVNEELEELDALLEAAPGMLRPGGRFVVLSFMSLEDRKIKRRCRDLAREGRVRLLSKRVVAPSEEEVRKNPASRSAKLRAFELLAAPGDSGAPERKE
jgi:16S rRNA (cytosine1402-N4)-methyltransferase